MLIFLNFLTEIPASAVTIWRHPQNNLLGELGYLISLSNLLAALDTLRQLLIEYALKILLQGIHVVADQTLVSVIRA